MKKTYQLCIYFVAILIVHSSCNNAEYRVDEKTAHDTTSVVSIDSIVNNKDTSGAKTVKTPEDSSTLSQLPKNGYAIVNCPGVMIKGIPGIVIAQITRKELQTAIRDLVVKLHQQDSTKSTAQISKETYGDSIMLFKKMKVVLEVDNDDIKKISTNNDVVKDFTNKQTLEWKWTIKPLIKKEKTIVTFNFYGIDDHNNETPVLQKSMNIGVEIDVRTFWDRWIDFLFDDTKTTITAILIPLITFLGGLFFGKRKEKK